MSGLVYPVVLKPVFAPESLSKKDIELTRCTIGNACSETDLPSYIPFDSDEGQQTHGGPSPMRFGLAGHSVPQIYLRILLHNLKKSKH